MLIWMLIHLKELTFFQPSWTRCQACPPLSHRTIKISKVHDRYFRYPFGRKSAAVYVTIVLYSANDLPSVLEHSGSRCYLLRWIVTDRSTVIYY
ncbi:hypothetical protein K432DRAFT_51833 [Lepidopterella palustris CBS 459.81]|uniref:Uncharacterized protein n=1 Tax=Lepidopterella palustris CBS 459.81 TaxID=1314670 RepID=A0A8E2EJY5_9PEZI|nr:hypothetical protein K432DRAFT_51833 [Lepidopterella palustris CBS 459.81]